MKSYDVLGYTADADCYCEACATLKYGGTDADTLDSEGNGLGAIFADSEWDTPAHCCACGAFLSVCLTGDGWNYTLEAIVNDLADGRTDSPALTEWAPEYGFPSDLEPDSLADRFDIVRGAYWACADWHGGQSSRGYRHLCKLGRHYRPGAAERTSSLTGDALAAYVRVAVGLIRRP